MPTDRQQRVYDLLRRMPTGGLAAVKQLFWTELNYDRANEPLSTRDWPERAQAALNGPPTLFAQLCALRVHDQPFHAPPPLQPVRPQPRHPHAAGAFTHR